jgi:hypothetical protein
MKKNEPSMNDSEYYEAGDVTTSTSAAMEPLAVFEIRAPFLRFSVFLWNLFMTMFIIFILSFIADKISKGETSIWIAFFSLCGALLPMHIRACCSSFDGSIAVYQDRIVQRNAFRPKTVRFADAFTMVHNPKFAGGPVLYLTENCPKAFFRRLVTILLLNDVMIIHIWMLSDPEIQRLANMLSELSGRPDTVFSTIGGFQSFRPRT